MTTTGREDWYEYLRTGSTRTAASGAGGHKRRLDEYWGRVLVTIVVPSKCRYGSVALVQMLITSN
jgi:hypothetical protein